MIGKLMQRNLNKLIENRVKFIVQEKYLEDKMGLDASIFNKVIVKEYVRQVKDNCYYDGVLLLLTIEIMLSKKKKNNSEYIDGNPNIINLTKTIVNTLKGIAFEKENQIVEILVNKIHGNENKITVELERI
jgi:Holliday junction resolvase RusA-like endonuclease